MFAVRLRPEFECLNCIKRKKQAERGCEKDAPFAYWTDRDGESRSRCPRRPIFEDPEWYNTIIQGYNFYKAGFLPHVGGMMDQAALFPFIMSCIEDISAECDRIEMDKPSSSDQGTSVLGKKPT